MFIMSGMNVDDASVAAAEFVRPVSALMAPYYQNPHDAFFSIQHGGGALFSEYAHAYEALNEFSLMQENWDGYGALRFLPETIEHSKSAIASLLDILPTPDIAPNSNGTISLEWETGRGLAHLEIGATKFSLYIRPQVGASTLIDGDAGAITKEIALQISAKLYPLQSNPMTRFAFATQQQSAA